MKKFGWISTRIHIHIDLFDLTKKLQSEYSHIAYIYILDKKTNTVTMKSIVKQRANPIMNKYVMIVCFDENDNRKVIDILVF